MLTDIGIDLTMSNEVHEAALKSLGYGQDENWRFIEIMDPKNSILTKSAPESKLKSAIEEYYSQNNLTKSGAEAETIDLLNSNVHIYWPYSEDWDGEETPAITFAPSDDSQLWNYGYKRRITAGGEVIIDKIIVDEEYAMENPVWIINYAEIPYENLPNFAKGEFTKNGITYLSENMNLNKSNVKATSQVKTGNKIIYDVRHGVKLTKFTSHYNWDSFWQGGSEFFVRATSLCPQQRENVAVHGIKAVINCGNIENMIFRSRSQCHNATPSYLSHILINDWSNFISHNAINVYENDSDTYVGNSTSNWMVQAGTHLKGDGKSVPVNISFPFWSGDSNIETYSLRKTDRLIDDTSVEHKRSGGNKVTWDLEKYEQKVIYK